MKAIVKKCGCGRVSNPITLEIVKDTWMKGGFIFFQFDCPQCQKEHTLKIEDKEEE